MVDRRGVRYEKRKHGEPPVAVEEEVPEGIERDDGKPEHRREGEVERDRRGNAGCKPEHPVHPVADVVVDVQRPSRIPGIERRDDRLPHDRSDERVVHELLGVGDGRVDPAHLEHEEERDQEGEIPGECRAQALLRVEPSRPGKGDAGKEREEGEQYRKAQDAAVPGEEREEKNRCRVCGCRREAAEGAVERRPGAEVERFDDRKPGEHRDDELTRQTSPPSRSPGKRPSLRGPSTSRRSSRSTRCPRRASPCS